MQASEGNVIPPLAGACACTQSYDDVRLTLIADTRKGNRPSFSAAAAPEAAEPLYARFCSVLADAGLPVERGVFGARMTVELVNDGPVTIVLDT